MFYFLFFIRGSFLRQFTPISIQYFIRTYKTAKKASANETDLNWCLKKDLTALTQTTTCKILEGGVSRAHLTQVLFGIFGRQ